MHRLKFFFQRIVHPNQIHYTWSATQHTDRPITLTPFSAVCGNPALLFGRWEQLNAS